MNKYFELALEEAKLAYLEKEIPVGAVVVYNEKVISANHNQKIKLNDITAHAEILAIKDASKVLGDWRLNNCDLYVTLKPCEMCESVIKESRISNVYFLLEKPEYKKGYSKTSFQHINNDLSDEYRSLINNFFINNTNR